MPSRFLPYRASLLWLLPGLSLLAGCQNELASAPPAASASPRAFRPATGTKRAARSASPEVLTPGKKRQTTLQRTFPTFAALPPEERSIVEKIRGFLASNNPEEQKQIAEEAAMMPAYDPAKVSGWLHAAAQFPRLPPGLMEIQVPIDRVTLDQDTVRPVTLRLPKGYSPDTPWPLIVAYHPTGGTGRLIISLLEERLGREIENYVVAAPANYRPASVESKRGISTEHRSVLRAVKEKIHADSDRVYVVGFSGGGYAAWSLATFYADAYAGVVPVGCTYDAAPEIEGVWERLMPNLGSLPVLHVWGGNDGLQALGFDLRTPRGAITELNQRVVALTKRFDLDIRNVRIPGGGHAFEPPLDPLLSLLEQRRTNTPTKVAHRFRHLHQARCYWLEGVTWDGDHWGLAPRNVEERPGETREQMLGRMIHELLGALKGEITGQTIRIEHSHLGELALWLGDGMIDWNQPITVQANGKTIFSGKVLRDLRLCLTEAKRTRDFDRLRWTLLISKAGEGRIASEWPASTEQK